MPILKKVRIPLLLGAVILLALLAAVPLVAAPLRPDVVTISGTVYFDKNGNGVRDANDGGIEGVTVQLSDTTTNGGVFNASLVTGVDGAFAFTGLPVDFYTISHAALPAYTPTTPAGVNLGMVETSRTVDFGDTLILYVTGIEYEDLNHDGGRAPLEPGIQGMTVKIYEDANTNGRVDLGETLLGDDDLEPARALRDRGPDAGASRDVHADRGSGRPAGPEHPVEPARRRGRRGRGDADERRAPGRGAEVGGAQGGGGG